MRDKLGLVGLVIVLLVAWGAGFLWFRGDLGGHATASRPHTSATPSPSVISPPASVVSGSTVPRQRGPVDSNPRGQRPVPVALPPVADFTMATFNALGSVHTAGRHSRRASGPQRMHTAVGIIAAHDFSVVGFQEFESNQRATFQALSPGWSLFSGSGLDGENAIAFRNDTWQLVQGQTVPIPYFHGGIRNMPYALLKNKATGITAWFADFHNPADVYGPAQRWRNEATSREIVLFNDLAKTGMPVFVTGDMNERSNYFCRITGGTTLHAAAGGSNSGGCSPPSPIQIDWIFASADVAFDGYTVLRDGAVRYATDHPVVFTHVTLDALKFPKAYTPPDAASASPSP